MTGVLRLGTIRQPHLSRRAAHQRTRARPALRRCREHHPRISRRWRSCRVSMHWIMPSSGYPPRSLVVQSEVTAFPAGWKGWPGIRTPTMDRTGAGRACASASCPRPMRSFNRRNGAWGFAPLRQRGSSSCGWASQRQSVSQLDSIARTGNGVAVRWVHAPCEKPDELIIPPFRWEPLRCLLWWLAVELASTV